MIKMIDSMKLDNSKLRDLAGSLRVLEAKSLELVPILEDLAQPFIKEYVIRPGQGKYRTEGGVSILEEEFATLQAALQDTRRRIKPALKTLKKSLQ
mgnify:CR=1 FL=1